MSQFWAGNLHVMRFMSDFTNLRGSQMNGSMRQKQKSLYANSNLPALKMVRKLLFYNEYFLLTEVNDIFTSNGS